MSAKRYIVKTQSPTGVVGQGVYVGTLSQVEKRITSNEGKRGWKILSVKPAQSH